MKSLLNEDTETVKSTWAHHLVALLILLCCGYVSVMLIIRLDLVKYIIGAFSLVIVYVIFCELEKGHFKWLFRKRFN